MRTAERTGNRVEAGEFWRLCYALALDAGLAAATGLNLIADAA